MKPNYTVINSLLITQKTTYIVVNNFHYLNEVVNHCFCGDIFLNVFKIDNSIGVWNVKYKT